MLAKRLIVTLILVPSGLALIYFGGPAYPAVVLAVLGMAAWEYMRMFQSGGYRPAAVIVVGGVLAIILLRTLVGFEAQYTPLLLSVLILMSLAYHTIAYERGRDLAALDFGVTLGGLFYLGWIGAYFVSLRNLPFGQWWVMLALPTVWLADTGAYVAGHSYGKHKLSPRLSPNKTWEGYWGGVITGVAAGIVIGLFEQLIIGSASPINWLRGGILGLVLSVLTPLGDLGESLFKRTFGFKDSGDMLPGHGGLFDRIDSWLWAAVIAYYLAAFFGLNP